MGAVGQKDLVQYCSSHAYERIDQYKINNVFMSASVVNNVGVFVSIQTAQSERQILALIGISHKFRVVRVSGSTLKLSKKAVSRCLM